MNSPSNPMSFWGLVLGGLVVAIYLGVGLTKNRSQLKLTAAINVLISTVSLSGAVRLTGFAFTNQLHDMKLVDGTIWSISSEDKVILLAGGLALAWVSVQMIWEQFGQLLNDGRNNGGK